MSISSLRSLRLSFLVLPLTTINAQISLASVPTSSCAGNPFGTATYSTQLTLSTQQTQQIHGGNFWQQAGANWTFSTDTPGIVFSQLGIPGWGANPSIPQSEHDALKLDDSKTKWTLSLPTTPPSNYEPDIIWLAQNPSNPSSGTAPGTLLSKLAGGVLNTASRASSTRYSGTAPQSNSSVQPGTVSGTVPSNVAHRVVNTLSGADPSRYTGTGPRSSSTTPSGTGFSGTAYSGLSTDSSKKGFTTVSSTGSSGTAYSRLSYTDSSKSSSRALSSSSTPTSSSSRTSSTSHGTAYSTASAGAAISKRFNRMHPSPTRFDPVTASTKQPIPELRARVPVGPKYRRAAAGTYQLTVVGNWGCLLDPKGSAPQPTAASNSIVASMCANNEISAVTESWNSYAVTSYMSSLLNANAPNPTFHPQVDGAAVIHNDVNPPGAKCTYTSKCDAVGCPDVKDDTSGTQLSVQRFLAYTSVVNFNNYLYAVYDALFNSGGIGSLMSAHIVTTYFTNPKPDATWEQIMGIFTPLLGMFSSLLGPFSGIASAALGAASGLMGAISAGSIASSIPPVADKRFDEFSTITDFIGEYLKATVSGIEHAYDVTIGTQATAIGWTGSPYAPNDMKEGYFGPGLWVDSDYTQGLSNDMYQKFVRIFTYKAINFAWIDSGAFIMFVPYGTQIKDTNGNMISGIDQNYCETQLKIKDGIGTLTVCDAGGGMARLINAGSITNGLLSGTIQGADAQFDVLPGEAFSVAGSVKGSVASWRTGDFKYDAANPYNSAFSSGSGFTDDQLQSISKLVIAEETAGFFNIPVCATFDLRFFPLTSGSSCTACGGAYGGTPGSTNKFMDNVSDKVKKGLQQAVPPDCTMGYEMPVCIQQCPSDVYSPKPGS